MGNRYYDYERNEDFTPTSANIICDDMKALATIKRDFLQLLEQIEKRVGKPAVNYRVSDAEIAEEAFDELLITAWNKLEQAYNEVPDADDYAIPKYPVLKESRK